MAAWETYPSEHQFPLGTPHIRDRLPLGRTFFSPKFTASKFALSAKNRPLKAEHEQHAAVVRPSARQDDRAVVSPTAPAPSLTQINPTPCASMVYPNNGSTTMSPTWKGFVHSTLDSLVIVEACLSGIKNHIPRRPHDRERVQLITSGSVFVYEENASGIKRWTDGITWSPSRIMGNYLVYRELKEPFPPGEKKRAAKRKRSADLGEDNEFQRQASNGPNTPNLEQSYSNQNNTLVEEDRKLVGSLVDSYGFKDGGLLKKTISIQIRGVVHHVICYYTVADVKEGKLLRPALDPELQKCKPRPELLEAAQNFRSPLLNDEDSMTPNMALPQAYGIGAPGQPQGPPAFTGYSGVDFGVAPYRDQRFASHAHPSMGAVFPGPSPTHNTPFQFTFGASQPLYNVNHYMSQPLSARTAPPRNMAMVRHRQFSVPAIQAQSYRPASTITSPPSATQPSIKRAYSTNSLRHSHLPADARSNGSVYVSDQPTSPQGVQQVPQQMYQLQSSNGSMYSNENSETTEQQQYFSQPPLGNALYTPTDTEPVVKPEVSTQYSAAVTSTTDHSPYQALDLGGIVDSHNSAVTSDNSFDFDHASYANLAHLPTPTSMSGRSDARYDSVVEHNSNGATPVQTTVESSGSFKTSQAPAYSFGSDGHISFDEHEPQNNQSYMRFNYNGGPVGPIIDTSVDNDDTIYPYSA